MTESDRIGRIRRQALALSPRRHGRARRAFVLVELIVVLIVLAVFSGMFGLSVSLARDKSKQSTCAGHLRHVASGWRQYAADHDGALVPLSVRLRDTGKSWEDVAAWPTLMKGYLDDPALEHVSPKSAAVALTAGGVLSCPAFTAGVGSHTPHFGMSHVAVQAGAGGWERLQDMPAPADTLVFAESRGFYVIGPTWGLQNLRYRHSGGTNAAFADGHIDWLTESALVDAAADYRGRAPWQPKPKEQAP
ncbi:MAG: type II secretion system protein [Lentisphaerae bacterium]|nr:type II secretion system protein [Lentisphaerota bacterium]